MATDKKDNSKTVVKPTAENTDPAIIDEKVVVDPSKEKAEMERIADVVRRAYEGKGSFSEDMPTDFEKTLMGKSEEEIIEAIKPYFDFADGSQKENSNVDGDIAQAAGIVEAIAGLSQSNEYKAQALKHMEAQNLKEIWRCPDTGYWFTRKDYAEEYERKNKCSPQHYKK